jgi:hypothetical protein
MYNAPAPQLRLVFRPPGFFLADVPVRMTVNEHPVFHGGVMNGFLVEVPMMEGQHFVGTVILGPVDRRRRYPVLVRPGCVTELLLEYSRIWGNFTSSPKIQYLPG